MSKPIEEGCRAIIVNSKAGNNGIEVTVGKLIGKVPKYGDQPVWATDKLLKKVYRLNGKSAPSEHCIAEKNLRRIDDNNEELSTWEAVESICGFNPAKQKVTQE